MDEHGQTTGAVGGAVMALHASEKAMIEQLRDHGLRATGQRLAVLRCLRENPTHPSAEEIYARLRPKHPTLSLSTVYKTLQTLAEVGVLDTIDAGDARQRFDGNPAPHHHAVCSRCRRVRDVPMEKSELPPPVDQLVPGFDVEQVKVYFSGVCEECERDESDSKM